MKIEVAKNDLEAAVAVVSMAVGSGSDISAHYLFRIRDGKVSLLSYNQRLFASSPLVCNVEGDEGGAFSVEAWRLDKWLAGVSDGVLTLTSEGSGDVQALGAKSKIRFRSLDPAKYPYWDELYSKAKVIGTIQPASLSRALDLTRWFVSADDTSKPELCQIEAISGILWATDRRALSSAEIPTLPDLNIRIPGKDVSAVMKFLGEKTTKERPVDIKEALREQDEGGGACAIFERPDGSYIGVTRPTTKFPKLNVDRDAPADAVLKVDLAELSAAISVLSAGAPKGHDAITFKYDKGAKSVSVSMPCEAGGADDYPLLLASVDAEDKFDSPFTVDYCFLKGIGSTFGLDTLDLGINRKGRGGFLSFSHTDTSEDGKGNRYYSVIVWRN